VVRVAGHLADQLVHVVRRVLQATKLGINGHWIAKAEERVKDKIRRRGGRGFRLGDPVAIDAKLGGLKDPSNNMYKLISQMASHSDHLTSPGGQGAS
jgi:hypothetical protein